MSSKDLQDHLVPQVPLDTADGLAPKETPQICWNTSDVSKCTVLSAAGCSS